MEMDFQIGNEVTVEGGVDEASGHISETDGDGTSGGVVMENGEGGETSGGGDEAGGGALEMQQEKGEGNQQSKFLPKKKIKVIRDRSGKAISNKKYWTTTYNGQWGSVNDGPQKNPGSLCRHADKVVKQLCVHITITLFDPKRKV